MRSGLGDDSSNTFSSRLWRFLLLRDPHVQSQVSGKDAHRADIVAGQTIETGIHLLDQIGTEVQFAFQPLAGQCHPAARRGRLAQRFTICRTDSQAQPAADAVQILFFGGVIVKFQSS